MLCFSNVVTAQDREALEFFEAKIRPVLVKECYGCHSAEAVADGKLRGGLLLDTREASQRGGESGPAVVPGKIDESLLIDAIRHESFEMPPKGKLPDSVIQDFVKWIQMGAPDPREGSSVSPAKVMDIEAGKAFWSFQPLSTVKPPPANSWTLTPIDQFIADKLKEHGIEPNPLASSRVLIRRAWYDLIGLPPTPDEMDHWLGKLHGSTSSNALPAASAIDRQAWSELIDHLLESPHYGERWARHWIDIARFAESHGYEQDYNRPNAYHYRDFLIKAFNSNLPYDQFIRWQLAGDEIAPDNPLAWMATGFLGGGAFPTQLTENEFESARYDELDDMVSTTGVAFLGLSIGCARCHDHKFDPIPSADYYRIAATFTHVIRTEKDFDLEPEANEHRRQKYDDDLDAMKAKLAEIERNIVSPALLRHLQGNNPVPEPSEWEILDGEVTSSAKTKFKKLDDGSYLATGNAPAKEVLTFTAKTKNRAVSVIRLEALAHESLPKKGPGRGANGNFVLGKIDASIQFAPGNPKNAFDKDAFKFVSADATFEQNTKELSVIASTDEQDSTGWAIDGKIGTDQAAVFRFARAIELPENADLVIRLTQNHLNKKHTLGRFRLSISNNATAPAVVDPPGPSAEVRRSLEKLKLAEPPIDSSTQQPWIDNHREDWQKVIAWFRTTVDSWRETSEALQKLTNDGPSVKLTRAMVSSEGLPHLSHHADGRGYPHFYPVTYQLRRGDVTQKGNVAEPGFLQVLLTKDRDEKTWNIEPTSKNSTTSFRRSALANWITDPEHGAGHLAARVMVNRLWQHHFGQGLVSTPNDFGASGERPTHPELLDWLAARLIEYDWKLKPLQKEIMESAVYMQSAELLLSTNGLVDPRTSVDPNNQLHWRRTPHRLDAEAIRDSMLSVGGDLDATMFGPGYLDQNMKRRSVYFFIKRSELIPMMMLFDWPEHLVSIGQRARTTIAPQALMFMNSPQGRTYAESFAKRIIDEKIDRSVVRGYQLALGRPPTAKEQAMAVDFIEQQIVERSTESRDQNRFQAVADFCQTLFSSNEFIYVE